MISLSLYFTFRSLNIDYFRLLEIDKPSSGNSRLINVDFELANGSHA